MTITVTNAAPSAGNDAWSVSKDVPLVIDAPGVLANDSDADGDVLTAEKSSGPTHGTVELRSDGSFTYTAFAGYTGPDAFTYRAFDGVDYSAVRTVNLTVHNDAPMATLDRYSTPAGQTLVVGIPGVLRNDTDANGDTIVAIKVSDPAHGTMSLGDTGGFWYLPEEGFEGQDNFTYKVFDGTAYSPYEVRVYIDVYAKVPGKIVAFDGVAGDEFGEAVAVSGDTALVGSRHHDSRRGAAYVYVEDGADWALQAAVARPRRGRRHAVRLRRCYRWRYRRRLRVRFQCGWQHGQRVCLHSNRRGLDVAAEADLAVAFADRRFRVVGCPRRRHLGRGGSG